MFTSRFGDGSGDIEEALQLGIRSIAVGKAGGRFLDIGSGFGRILTWLEPYAGSLYGVEPDRSRFERCQELFQHNPKVQLLNASAGNLAARRWQRRFDLVTVSMVLQHISRDTCHRLLVDVCGLLRDGGVAVVVTTHFPDERFTYERDELPSDAAAFDRYADCNTASQALGLPVRQFSRQSLTDEIERAGLRVEVWQQFTYPRPNQLDRLAEQHRLPAGELQDCGFSQLALVRRAERPSRPLRDLVRRVLRGTRIRTGPS